MRKCADCSAEIPPRTFRCTKHHKAHELLMREKYYSDRSQVLHPTILCDICGAPMRQRTSMHKTCSLCVKEKEQMRYIAKRSPKDVAYIKCAVCGIETPARSANKKYCEKCRDKSYKAKIDAWQLAHPQEMKTQFAPGTIINTMFPNKLGSEERLKHIINEIARRAQLPGYDATNPFPEAVRL